MVAVDVAVLVSCAGEVVEHGGRRYECSNGAGCPGPHARHQGHAVCPELSCQRTVRSGGGVGPGYVRVEAIEAPCASWFGWLTRPYHC